MSFWTEQWLPYVFDLHTQFDLPAGVELLDPYTSEEVREACHAFYMKYYGDDRPRRLLMGINPGRLGAGITGINFTDPVQLEERCHIPNPFDKRAELSARFIYDWIDRQGGPESFYSQYIILAICPLGFVHAGKNMNYYDRKDLLDACTPIIDGHQRLLEGAPLDTREVYILGKGTNLKAIQRLNARYHWFDQLVGLPHPRWVMQYRYKTRYEWMDEMTEAISSAG